MPPSITGTLTDNAVALEALYGQALADLPFNAYYIAETDLAVAAAVAREPLFQVRGSHWTPVQGTTWRAVAGRAWARVPGTSWSPIRRP